MTYRVTFTIECPDWAPTGLDEAVVVHHAHKDGAVLSTRRADIDDWIGRMRRHLNGKAWQEVSGFVVMSTLEVLPSQKVSA